MKAEEGLPASSAPGGLEFAVAVPEDTPAPMDAQSSVGSVGQPSAMMAILTRTKDSFGSAFKDRKPWMEVLDRTSFSKPTSVSEVSTRIQKNVRYYRTNYLMFFLATMCLTFLTNPKTLIWTGCLVAVWTYLFLIRSTPLVINGREYSEREKLIAMSAISFIVVFFLTNVGAIVLYGASLSMAVVALHGAFREPDDLFLDDAATGANMFDKVNIFQGVQGLQPGPSNV